MTAEEARKEDGYTLEEFKKVYRRIYGFWNPDKEVVVYEFKLVEILPLEELILTFLKPFKLKYDF